MCLSALPGRDAADHFGSVGERLRRVKGGLAAGETLHQQSRVFVDQDAHFANPTTFSAASRMPSATVKLNPDSLSIVRPNSTLVPSMRTTIGTFTASSRAAAITPVASVSQRRMPPKM